MGKGRIKRRLRLNPVLQKGILILLVIISFIFLIWQRSEVYRVGREIRKMEDIKKGLLRENKRLILEVATLSSVERIERIASGHLRLAAPNRRHIYIVKRAGGSPEGNLLAKGPQRPRS